MPCSSSVAAAVFLRPALALAGLLLLGLALPTGAVAQQELEFAGHTWEVRGDMKAGEYLGRPALLARTGFAQLKDSRFRDGVIEFDMAVAGPRSFAGLAFRVNSATGSYEDFYLRPHNSGRFDAMQYTPVFHHVSAWQLYPEYNASTEIPRDKWIHVRLVIAGSDLQVFLDQARTPVLHVAHLRGNSEPGAIALKAFFPGGAAADIYPTAFSRLIIQSDEDEPPLLPETRPAGDAGIIASWSLSPTYPAPAGLPDSLPAMPSSNEDWTMVATDETGRLNLARHRSFPQDAGQGAVLARVVIHADKEQTRRLSFGFSDQVGVFLNGRPLFAGDNTYRTRSPKYLGVMTADHQALYLDLHQGANELLFFVAESFGGWGLTARLDSLQGLRLQP